MRRADRLFQIIQVLRRTRKPLTADAIAAELETSKRTIYRDISTLIEQRVPIRGEAGMGYILEKGFDLPPLMLTPDEIEAAVLGAQWVAAHADPVLARAAQDLMAKIADTVPERLRPFVLEPASRARPVWNREPDRIDMVRTRSNIHEGKKITLNYRDEHGRESQRTIWPIAIGYHEAVRILAAWCELRKDFRSFRTDRVVDAVYHDEKYPERRDLLHLLSGDRHLSPQGEEAHPHEDRQEDDRHAIAAPRPAKEPGDALGEGVGGFQHRRDQVLGQERRPGDEEEPGALAIRRQLLRAIVLERFRRFRAGINLVAVRYRPVRTHFDGLGGHDHREVGLLLFGGVDVNVLGFGLFVPSVIV